MCGITGFVYDEPRDPAHVERTVLAMSRKQAFRGPDGLAVWTDGRVGFGIVRLAIVGFGARGEQPITGASGARLVFNGELYDPDAVMASLGGRLASDESDGVALLRLLETRGVDGLRAVSAMFAAALHDPARDDVLLVRDAWGEKPLYLRRWDGGWAFASTVAALHAGTGPLRIRPAAMHECLIFKSVGGCRSAFDDVRQLPPGSWLRIARGGAITAGRWFEPPGLRADVSFDDALAAATRQRVARAIEQRCPEQHRAAIFLSGGLDSSIVATVARGRGTSSPHVFTVGYDVGGWQDEHALAERLADQLGLEHQALVLYARDVPALLRDTAVALEDPVHDPVTVPTLALSRAAARTTKVVLTGDGSDEFWGGYARFDDPPEALDAYLERTMVFRPGELGLERPPASYLDEVVLPPADAMAPLDRYLRLEAANRLRNYHLARVDKLSMAAGLEARSPFLDRAVTTFAASLPARVKRPDGRAKGLLVDAFAPLLPAWLLERRKQPFTVPIQAWLDGALRELAHDVVGAPNAFVRSLLDPAPLLAGGGALDAEARALRLWSLLHLEIWHRELALPLARRAETA